MASMGCEDIRDLLPLVAGGEARDEERLAVKDHVSHCAPCSRELDLFREARTNLALLREGDVPAGTWKSIWGNVRADLFPLRASRSLFYFDLGLRYAAVLMVGLAVGVGSYVVTRPARAVPSPAEPAASPAPPIVSVQGPPAPIQPVISGTLAPFRGEVNQQPKFYAPRAKPDGNSYLPRVEAIPVGGERDY
jgi:hypothetical protein